ncbi:hypothetical protein DITRI_Ditri04bG0012500 [Diplodiscus trichospermus]
MGSTEGEAKSQGKVAEIGQYMFGFIDSMAFIIGDSVNLSFLEKVLRLLVRRGIFTEHHQYDDGETLYGLPDVCKCLLWQSEQSSAPMIAVGISIGVGIHAISHLACDLPRLLHATPDEYEPMMRERMNLPKPLNKLTGFNSLWYSHHLFFIVYTLLIVHGIKLLLTKKWYKKTTWMYLAVPVILYFCEGLIRLLRSSIKAVTIHRRMRPKPDPMRLSYWVLVQNQDWSCNVTVWNPPSLRNGNGVAVHPRNVLALHNVKESRPHGFRYKSGQYMFVNCAAVSPFEWHPFSITSAPGDAISVFILGLLVCQRPTNGKSGLLRADILHGTNNPE